MRTQLLCTLAMLCGAGVVHAQGWAAGGAPAPTPGYGPSPYALGYPAYAAGAGYGYAAPPGGYWGYDPSGLSAAYGYMAPPSPPQPAIMPPVMPPADLDAPPAVVGPAGPICNYCAWAAVAYTMSWLRPVRTPTPLVTTGSAADLHPGALGQPGTAVLFGDHYDYDMFSGVRTEIGAFLDEGRHVSLEGVGQFFQTNSVNFTAASDAAGNPIITRPIFNVVTNEPRAFATSFPGIFSGADQITARAALFSGEVNLRYWGYASESFRGDVLLGFRYLYLGESLNIRDTLVPLVPGALPFEGGVVSPPDTLAYQDTFRTRNHFYGMQVGARLRWDCSWAFLSAYGKLALGGTDQTVNIQGVSGVFTPTGSTLVPGGILALASNSGDHRRTRVSLVPETGLTVGVKLTPNIQLTAGYSFLLWSNVVRPGRQIDPVINPTLVPTDASFGTPTTAPLRPMVLFNNEVVWLHTLSLGVAFQY